MRAAQRVRLKDMARDRILSPEDLRLVDVSGVEGFDVEAERDGKVLFGFSCDEEDGPVTVSFGLNLERVQIDLAALRSLLDTAEADLRKRRRDWREANPDA